MGRKLDPDSTRSERLFKLYDLLRVRKYTTSELQEKLNCSKQTIRSMIDAINASSETVVIEEEDKRTRRKSYYIEQHKRGMNDPIALEGFRQMELCRDLIGNVLPEEDFEKLNLAIKNASNFLPRKELQNFRTLSIASGYQKGFINYSSCTQQFHDLFRSINEKKCCVLQYEQHIGEKIKEHYFAPMRLLCMHDCFYIIGWITDKDNPEAKKFDTPTKFLVQRIKSVQVLEKCSSENLPEVSPENEYFGVITGSEEFEVILRFRGNYAKTYIADRIWSKDQCISFNEDGSLILKFKSKSFYEVLSFVNSFGSQVEVIAPKEIREAVKDDVKNLVKMYGIS